MLQFKQLANVKFCQNVGKSSSETFQMIKQGYDEETLGIVLCLYGTNVLHRDILEDGEHTGRPRTFRTELKIREVATLVRANRSQMADEIAAAAEGINHGTCHRILSDGLNVSRVNQHSVPRILVQDQRDGCMSICDDLTDSADKAGTFLNLIIIGDKTWCFL
jgi:hypothetical protein